MNSYGSDDDLRPQTGAEAGAVPARPVVTWPQYLLYIGGCSGRLLARWGFEMLRSYGFATYPQLTEIMLENEHCSEGRSSTVWTTPPRDT